MEMKGGKAECVWTRFGIEFFRDGLDHAGIYHVTERWGCWPSATEKTLSLPSWILGCTMKSDALV